MQQALYHGKNIINDLINNIMRAREFTINVPIKISINGDDDPVVSTDQEKIPDENELHQNPVMISPQQQELELKKAELGKNSPVIDKLTQDNTISQEPQELADNDLLSKIKALLNK